MDEVQGWECSVCGERYGKLWRYQWNNGVIQNVRYYCRKCRKEHAPPLGQFKAHGGYLSTCERYGIEMGFEVQQ